MRIYPFILIFLLVATSSQAKMLVSYDTLSKLGSPHYVTGGAYIFDFEDNPYAKNQRRVISSYVPDGTLVFPLNLTQREKPKDVNLSLFQPYITQYGQIVLIRKNQVSKNTFKQNYKELNILFHRDSFTCPTESEINCTEDEGDHVPETWVALSETTRTGVKLTFFNPDGSPLREGYLSHQRFAEMEKEGVISDVNKTWPKYALIEKKSFSKLSKPCGPEKVITDIKKFEKKLSAKIGGDVLEFISAAFNMRIIGSEGTESTLKIGGPDVAIRRFEYVIAIPNDKGEFSKNRTISLYVTAEYHCVGLEVDSQDYYVKKAILNGDTAPFDKRITIKREDFYSKKLSDEDAEFIWNHNRSVPMFFSVNHPSRYERIIEKIRSKTNYDIAASNLVLSIFNGTCESRENARTRCRRILD